MSKIGKSISEFLNFIWNPKEKQFLGRDGGSWAKVCFFYFIFYAILSGFFIGMLAIFNLTLDKYQPRYFDKSSTMSIAKNYENGKAIVNPAVGFRPQPDPETSLIYYSKSTPSMPDASTDFLRLNRSLELFFDKYYSVSDPLFEIENCDTTPLDEVRQALKSNKHCPFHYEHLIAQVNETGNIMSDDPFGYKTIGPTVVLKVNRIYGWLPVAYDINEDKGLPEFLREIRDKNQDKKEELEELVKNHIIVKCDGEFAADIDKFRNYKPKYYSVTNNSFSDEFGVFPFYYYPYLNQKNYESPLAFIQFNTASSYNVLTNVICKAYAKNIDSDDKLNKRGMTQFIIYIEK